MPRLSWLLGGTLKRKSSKTPPPPVARIRKGRGGDEGPLYVIDVVTMDIGMAHLGCWKSFPTACRGKLRQGACRTLSP
jgi:hypothetical protein